ncbi:hypothetical protein LCGC14_1895380, partial [marine sediment metagenome]
MAEVFYSVCPRGTADLKDVGDQVSITSGVLTLETGDWSAKNIGVGVNIEYNSLKCFISAVNSATSFDVLTATGGTPGDQATTDVTSLHHEYTSLSAAEAGFTDASHVNNTDLSAATGASTKVNICCYADDDDQTADSTTVTIDYGTDDADYYVNVYTPNAATGSKGCLSDESGQGTYQRHDGKWNANAYYLEMSVSVLRNSSPYTRIEGLQLHLNGGSNRRAYWSETTGAGEVWFTHSIAKATLSGGDASSSGIYLRKYNTVHVVHNNVVYDFINAANSNWGINRNDGTGRVYNNTVYNCRTGVYSSTNRTGRLKNNVVKDCTGSDYAGTFHANSTHNIGNNAASELAFGATHEAAKTTDGTEADKLVDSSETFPNVVVGNVVKNTTDTTYTYVTSIAEAASGKLGLNDDIFISGENYNVYTNKFGSVTFENEGADDFHLGSGDTLARGEGSDLSGEGYFTDDVDGDARDVWSIGADEGQSGVTTYNGSAAITLASLSVTGSGTYTPLYEATVTLTLGSLSVTAAGTYTPLYQGSGTLTVGSLIVAAAGTLSYQGTGSLTVGSLSVSGAATYTPLYQGTGTLTVAALSVTGAG